MAAWAGDEQGWRAVVRCQRRVGQDLQELAQRRSDLAGDKAAARGPKKNRFNTGGADFSPDGHWLYWSGGDDGKVYLFDTAQGQLDAEIPLNTAVAGREYEDSYVVDVKVSEDGRYLFCADVTNFRVVVIDAEQRKVLGSVPVGRYPYALAVVGDKVYAANIGLFEYSAVRPPNDPTLRHARAHLSRRSAIPAKRRGTAWSSRAGEFPAWANPMCRNRFPFGASISLPTRSAESHQPPEDRPAGRRAVGQRQDGGRQRAELPGRARRRALRLQRQQRHDSSGLTWRTERDLRKGAAGPSPLVAGLRGVSPSGMAAAPDGKRLYVAELGINAIAVLDAQTLAVLGHIPTAWYPYRRGAFAGRPAPRCASVSAGSATARTPAQEVPKSDFLGMRGVLSVLKVPSDAKLAQMTADVLAYNGMVDRSADREAMMSSPRHPDPPGNVSKEIKYVVFITKENHTYDTIFDRIPGREARSQPAALGTAPNHRGQGPAHARRRGRDDEPQRPGAAVHRERQLLHGAGGVGRGPSVAGGRAAEQPDADDLLRRLEVQERQPRAGPALRDGLQRLAHAGGLPRGRLDVGAPGAAAASAFATTARASSFPAWRKRRTSIPPARARW